MVPPWFASASRRKPQRVLTYPGAVTGAPVAACAEKHPQSARGSKTMFSSALCTLFHQPGSLPRSSLPTLLFTAFAKIELYLVYVKTPPSSRGNFSAPRPICPRPRRYIRRPPPSTCRGRRRARHKAGPPPASCTARPPGRASRPGPAWPGTSGTPS